MSAARRKVDGVILNDATALNEEPSSMALR